MKRAITIRPSGPNAAAQKNRGKIPLLPEAWRQYLRRRAEDGLAVALLILSAYALLALASYDSMDSSWNVAGGRGISNLAGTGGAILADALLQSVGLGALLVPLILGAWGCHLLIHRPLPVMPLRVMAALGGIGMCALAAGAVSGQSGGMLGFLLARPFASLMMSLGVPTALIGLPALAIGLLLAGWAGGLTFAKSHALMGGFASVTGKHLIPVLRDMFGSSKRPDTTSSSQLSMPTESGFQIAIAAKGDDRPVSTPKRAPRSKLPATAIPVEENGEGPQLPPLDLLQQHTASQRPTQMTDELVQRNARLLEGVLADFGIKGAITRASPGPVITLYELEPAPGVKSSRVVALADDIARSMSASSARIAVVPGRNALGIELPNPRRETVWLRELLLAEEFTKAPARLALALGKDISGAPVMADLARMPHLLVAGTTGSGKSVAINAMILSLLFRLKPEQCRLLMIDPKMLELSVYEGIPHLLAPVVTEPRKAVVALKWAVREMEERYRAMSRLGVRNIEGYNQRLSEARRRGEVLTRKVQTGFDPDTGRPVFEEQPLDLTELPSIVVIVDEMADLMLLAGKDIEAAIQRLSQMARAAGIHLIMATQRPSVDVITGTIKANFPTRISFQVTSRIDSRTILGEQGAEQLLGQGDMLFMTGGGRMARVHGPFVRDEEVEAVVRFLKTQGTPEYLDDVTVDEEGEELFSEDEASGAPGTGDPLYDKAVDLILREGKASTSFLQRHLQLGYNRAARIIDRMEREGVITGADHVGRRRVMGGGE
ncbi:MAG: DNA translocase FtsK 4TM domain-containing protein [Alphaproteobacteria bacterium]|nr:MAG: DNA translocase FtsK 4TM domain-containing protein [Alphaproteobacteria bacterium]